MSEETDDQFIEAIRIVHRRIIKAMKRGTGCYLSADDVQLLGFTQLGEDEAVTLSDRAHQPEGE